MFNKITICIYFNLGDKIVSTKACLIIRLFLILTFFTLACSSSEQEGETPTGGDMNQPVMTGM